MPLAMRARAASTSARVIMDAASGAGYRASRFARAPVALRGGARRSAWMRAAPPMRSRDDNSRAEDHFRFVSEWQLHPRLRVVEHLAEIALDALHRTLGVRLEAQHDHRRGVRRARKAEAIGILYAQAVDAHHVLGTGEAR